MKYSIVSNCPLPVWEWSSRASSTCSDEENYHCVEDEYSRIVEVCTETLWIEAGRCPTYNTVAGKMTSQNCSGNPCPEEMYRSNAVYKYHGCLLSALGASRTTSSSVYTNTIQTQLNTSETSIITGSVTSMVVVILLAIFGNILWRKRRTFEKNTPTELDADNGFISECQDYLQLCDNTIAMFGKLGSGKRTLAAQVAIRLAKKNRKLKIKIVREGGLQLEDFGSRQSTILVIHDPVKTWFTSKHTAEVMRCLLQICTNAKKNNSYIITIFHSSDWESFERLFGNNYTLIETICPRRLYVSNEKQKLAEIAKNIEIGFSNITIQLGGANIGGPLMMTMYLKNREFQHYNFLSYPTMFIFRKLKNLERSPQIHDQILFKLMIFAVLHDGEIAKSELDYISHHALFVDMKEKMDIEGSINRCIEQLLGLFIEETLDGRSYRILHDVITRCTFLAAMENHKTLLFTECDPILIFECVRLKSTNKKIKYPGQIVYDDRNLQVGLPTEIYPEVARLFCKRSEMRSVVLKSRLYDNQKFKEEWNKAEQYFTNRENVEVN